MPSKCSLCLKGNKGENCRLKNCDFYKGIKATMTSKTLKATDVPPEGENVPGMLQLVPLEPKHRYKRQVIRERKLKNNKISDDVTMIDMRVLSTNGD